MSANAEYLSSNPNARIFLIALRGVVQSCGHSESLGITDQDCERLRGDRISPEHLHLARDVLQTRLLIQGHRQ